MNVAVTAVGGIVGQSVIKALNNTEYSVVGINSEVLGAGLFATKKSYIGLNASDPQFVYRLIEICKKANCNIVFSGLDAELIHLSNSKNQLEKDGIFAVVSDPEIVKICGDKLKTIDFLKSNHFPAPETFNLRDYSLQLDFPVILKPKTGGQASQGLILSKNLKDFEKAVDSLNADNYVVQEFIEGDEYTCGTVSFENRCIGAILMKRELRFGNTYKAFVVQDEKLAGFVKNVVDVLRPFGPCNVQLRLRQGIPYIFEFNARCSGTTAMRALAGFNEPKMVCDYLSKGIANPFFKIKEIVILRYWNEIAVDYEKIRKMESTGFIENDGINL
jgi:carbamoyl-phosphate synthase large subunit